MAMRSVLLRCLVVLVALTFVGSATVNAQTHSMPSGAEGPPFHDTADAGTSFNKSPQHHNAHTCPCCCLGCASFANRAPDGTSGVVPVSAIVSYDKRINALGACLNSRCSTLSESDSTLGYEQVFSPLEYRSNAAAAAECAGLRAERPCLAIYRRTGAGEPRSQGDHGQLCERARAAAV